MRNRFGFGTPFEVGSFRQALEQKIRGSGTAVMGVLNVTPDSFYDGGRYVGADVPERIDQLISEGAFVVDIGAESTRPQSAPVPAALQLERLEAAVRYAVGTARCWVSIDTSDPEVADATLNWGAHLINDVSCLARPDLAAVTARHGAALIIMHARGSMLQMAGFSEYPDGGYGDVILDTVAELRTACDLAVKMGMAHEDLLIDPGIGFAKNARQSLTLLTQLRRYSALNAPIVLGPSRKSFLKLVEDCPAESRLGATVAACLFAASQGAALVRVHDVQVIRQALEAARIFDQMALASHENGGTCLTAP